VKKNLLLVLCLFSLEAFPVSLGCHPCIDNGSSLNCNGFSGGTYRYYCNGLAYGDAACVSPFVCDCPTPPSGDPCVSCGYTNQIGTTNCFNDGLCTSNCVVVPEFPFKIFIPLMVGVSIFVAVLMIRRRKRV